MLTIFAVPKAFRGHFAIIQENAIASWARLKPKPEIILLGEEEGIQSICKKYKLIQVKKIKKNNLGTPLLSDVFEKAKEKASNSTLAYINCDIILFDNFTKALNKIKHKKYLVTGRRWNIEIKFLIKFKPSWQKSFTKQVLKNGKLDQFGALDYFIFPKSVDFKMPPFAIGRTIWDNWLLYRAKLLRIPIVDATEEITAVHQNHDYSHAGGLSAVWQGEERERNLKLAAGKKRKFNLTNSDLIITKNGLEKPAFSVYRMWRNLQVYPVINPKTALFTWPPVILTEFLIKIYRRVTVLSR